MDAGSESAPPPIQLGISFARLKARDSYNAAIDAELKNAFLEQNAGPEFDPTDEELRAMLDDAEVEDFLSWSTMNIFAVNAANDMESPEREEFLEDYWAGPIPSGGFPSSGSLSEGTRKKSSGHDLSNQASVTSTTASDPEEAMRSNPRMMKLLEELAHTPGMLPDSDYLFEEIDREFVKMGMDPESSEIGRLRFVIARTLTTPR